MSFVLIRKLFLGEIQLFEDACVMKAALKSFFFFLVFVLLLLFVHVSDAVADITSWFIRINKSWLRARLNFRNII
jgi:hypothetical protein